MSDQGGIPKEAAIAVGDLLDNCARIQPGQEVLILAHTDGLHGGDNMVDREAISWIESGIKFRGANASVLWIDEPARAHEWRLPPIAKAAMAGCDVLINHSFNVVREELSEFRKWSTENKKPMVRNFATTAPLLCSAWAQTPNELVSEIRYRASLGMQPGLSWELSDPNGTHLEGVILPSTNPSFPTYWVRREEFGVYRPWPEWVSIPVSMGNLSGTFVFDCMHSWWSRYIGISPYFESPISLTVQDGKITKIVGGSEAEALKRFLDMMRGRLGEGVYSLNTLHFGVHPQAVIAPHQCPNVLHRRLIEHSHTCNVHVHIGAPPATVDYPYWMHITGDIRNPTFRVGDTLVHDKGHLTALDDPKVIEVAAKYPGRPGLAPEPRNF